MPGNLLTRVQHLCAISQRSLLTPDQSYAQGHGAYGEALRLFWGGDFARAADCVTALLVDVEEPQVQFAAYRLWLEALAEQSDSHGLKQLGEHLFRVGRADPDGQPTYAALRGLVHLELDELGAARLLARGVATHFADPYAMELVQLVANRAEGQAEPVLTLCETPLVDYFHWQTLARGLLNCDEQAALELVLGGVREQCPAATLPYLFEFHLAVDGGYYGAASIVAERLVEIYPESVDYQYYRAYALFEDGDYPQARQVLQLILERNGDDDAEVVGLLGHCYAKLGDPQAAAKWLKRSVALLKSAGLPTSHVSLELADVEEELRGDELDPALTLPRMTRKWLVNLSPRRYHELLISSPGSIERLLRPMGPEPRTGDFCFFATTTRPDQDGSAQWKIVAIYALDGDPIWHPTYGYHSALRLVTRLPDGLPVDIKLQPEAEVRAATPRLSNAEKRRQHIHYGVYELDNYAIDIIEDAVHMSREDMIERRRGSAQSRRPTA